MPASVCTAHGAWPQARPQIANSARPAAEAPRPWRPSAAARRQRRSVAAAAAAAPGGGKGVQLTLPDGTSVAMPLSSVVIGSGAGADLQLSGSGVAAQHARLESKGGRLFVTALTGDPDLLLAPTAVWLDGVELRPNVSYMVAPGARLAVGSPDTAITCAFEEGGGSSPLLQMAMQGLVAGASKEVQEKMGGL